MSIIIDQKTNGTQLLTFLSNNDRNNISQVNKLWREIVKTFDIQCYLLLNTKICQKNSILYITDKTGPHQEMLLDVLGAGGSKKAIQLEGGKALIIPNMSANSISSIEAMWKKMVYEEVAMSQLLTSIGLLSPLSKRVSISLSPNASEGIIPAYTSETFESLGKTKDWFIIDIKNSKSSTWIKGKDFLFNSEEDRLNEENWDSVTDLMLTDVLKICAYNIPAGGDALNIAIVKKSDLSGKSMKSKYEVRYFGFDFSSKNPEVLLSIPQIKERPSLIDTSGAKPLLFSLLDFIFFYEFGDSYESGEEKLTGLRDRLIVRYRKELVSRREKLKLTTAEFPASGHALQESKQAVFL